MVFEFEPGHDHKSRFIPRGPAARFENPAFQQSQAGVPRLRCRLLMQPNSCILQPARLRGDQREYTRAKVAPSVGRNDDLRIKRNTIAQCNALEAILEIHREPIRTAIIRLQHGSFTSGMHRFGSELRLQQISFLPGISYSCLVNGTRLGASLNSATRATAVFERLVGSTSTQCP